MIIRRKVLFQTLTIVCCVLLLSSGCVRNNSSDKTANADTSSKKILSIYSEEQLWKAPDTLLIPGNDSGKMILYGRMLIKNTSQYFGPHGVLGHFTNGMNCQNCHLDAGTKPFGNNYSAVASTYPKFRARSGSVESIEKRVNDCFERSLNGKAIDSAGKEMRAIVAYMKWLGQNVSKGEVPKGAGIMDLPFLNRAADPEKGKIIFNQKCITCHGEDGQGKFYADAHLYQYPPLWGPNSYTIGAGLYRVSRFAGYIRANMPFITTPENPPLTNEEAWDIAAFVNSKQRPDKDISKDWPDISKKPFDHPFGPYSDHFDEAHHKFGPFAEIVTVKKK
jgi:thiosulfate dehydrogenase